MNKQAITPRYDIAYDGRKYDAGNRDTVAVIVLCYNQAEYVDRCLEGVLGQTYSSIKYIIVDDCSTDESVQCIISHVASKSCNVIVIRNRYNQHVSAALNNAMHYVDTDYVSIIAMDDEWFPRKIQSQVELLQSCDLSYCAVYSDAECIDEAGKALGANFLKTQMITGHAPDGMIYSRLLLGNFIPAHSLLIRCSSIRQVGLFDERLIYEDWDMWLRMAYIYRYKYQDEVLVKYRILPNSITRTVLNQKSIRWHEANYYIYNKQVDLTLNSVDHEVVMRKIKKTAKWLHMLGSDLALKALLRCMLLDADFDIFKYLIREFLGIRGKNYNIARHA